MAHPGEFSGVPTSSLQLSFEANGLRNRDLMGKSDPMLVVYGIDTDGKEIELGRSETIPNTLNPRWVFQLAIEYHFEETQHLRFVVFDVDSNYKDKTSNQFKLSKQDFLGEVRTVLAEIAASSSNLFKRELKPPAANFSNDLIGPRGTLTIRAEEMVTGLGTQEAVDMTLHCSNLENLEVFSKSDPFLKISKEQQDGSMTPVYQTKEKQNNLNPEWEPFCLPLQQLCNGNKDRPLLIECFDYNGNGKHKLIGWVKSTFNQLQEHSLARTPVILTRPSSNPKHAKKSRGTLYVRQCKLSPVYSFLDYILGGCEINFFVAVDFTASNGNPYQPGSLHYLDPTRRPNAYQTAIQAVGEILQYYDTDKRFPCWGFGARINGVVSHCFNLNGSPNNPEVTGIEGILAAYSQAVYAVELYGPTWFAPVVRQAAAIAAQYKSQQKYFVLLIITDGAILDMHETVTAIVEAASLPLSLLILGVGNADFSAMDTLDADNERLTTQSGQVAVRDIVQFVPLKGGSLQSAATKLLKELPGQLISYMKTYHITPMKPGPQPIAPVM